MIDMNPAEGTAEAGGHRASKKDDLRGAVQGLFQSLWRLGKRRFPDDPLRGVIEIMKEREKDFPDDCQCSGSQKAHFRRLFAWLRRGVQEIRAAMREGRQARFPPPPSPCPCARRPRPASGTESGEGAP